MDEFPQEDGKTVFQVEATHTRLWGTRVMSQAAEVPGGQDRPVRLLRGQVGRLGL